MQKLYSKVVWTQMAKKKKIHILLVCSGSASGSFLSGMCPETLHMEASGKHPDDMPAASHQSSS